MLLSSAFMVDVYPPRVLRAMVERFAVALPFLSRFFLGNGAVLGDRQNCIHLLERGESVLVFPEGVKGISKSTPEYYHMKPFSRGFFRLALQAGTDILPVAVVGAEEFYPLVYHSHKLAKAFGLPSAPISPLFPFAGLLGIIPLPSPVDIYIGEPYPIPKDISAEAPDHVIDAYVEDIQKRVDQMLQYGVQNRRPFWGAHIASDIMNFIKDKGPK
jgi:1-acyl-sn-glycerol-3-phosphate acyltransferase